MKLTELDDVQLKQYIYTKVSDYEWLALLHRCLSPDFQQTITTIIEEFGLTRKLEVTQQSARHKDKFHILDVGCSEGLYLHDVANILESRQLLQAATFWGVDTDLNAIETAHAYCKVSKPPRENFNFFIHNINNPLDDCEAFKLELETPPQFDLILCLNTLLHLSNTKEIVKHLFTALKPQATLYILNVNPILGEEGYFIPNNQVASFFDVGLSLFRKLHNEGGVAAEIEEALSELGAEPIKTFSRKIPLGGKSEMGLLAMKAFFLSVINSSPRLIEAGIISKNTLDDGLEMLFRELTQTMQGHAVYTHIVARKP